MKKCTVVWDSNPHEGQRELGISPILSRYEWRKLQKEERICESLLLYGLGKFASSGAVCGEAV